VAVKLLPYFSSVANVAHQVCGAGADGLVLFNRYFQPDLDIEERRLVRKVTFTQSDDLLLPLHWIASLSGTIGCDLAISSGVHSHVDVIKGIMAGANVTMLASELLEHGIERVAEILEGIRGWLDEHEIGSLTEMYGVASYRERAQPEARLRANYMQILQGWPDCEGRMIDIETAGEPGEAGVQDRP
jgi:dihydroorotate dehydrogenase (fumarate)